MKAYLEPLSGPRVFGYAPGRKDRLKVSSELAQDRRAWSSSVLDVVNPIGGAQPAPSECQRKYKKTAYAEVSFCLNELFVTFHDFMELRKKNDAFLEHKRLRPYKLFCI